MCRFLHGDKFSTPLGKFQQYDPVILDHMVRVCLILKKLPNCLLEWLYHLAFLPAMNESSCYSAILSAFGGVSVLDFSHSDRCVVGSHCFQSVLSLICICRYYARARAHRQCTQVMWAEFKTEQ